MAQNSITYKGYKIDRADYTEDNRTVKSYAISISGYLLAVESSLRACKAWINDRLYKY